MKQPAVLEHLQYIAKRTFKGHALYLSLNGVTEAVRTQILSAAADYEQAGSCVSFSLQNQDTVLFFNNNKAHHLMLLALKIKSVAGSAAYPTIVTAYDLKKQYALLHNRIYKVVLVPDMAQLHTLSVMRKIPHKPFSEADLKTALHHLSETSLTHLIRKQPVYATTAAESSPLFTGWFVRLSDIRRALIPDVDIHENGFFYALLRQAVEMKVLEKITEQADWTGGLNISVGAFQTRRVKEWLATHTPVQRRAVLFEFAFDDFVQNADAYRALYQHLSPLGYQFIIRLNTWPLFLTPEALPTDFIKIPAASAPIEQTDKSAIIICGVEDNSTKQQISAAGFGYIQGGYIGLYPRG
ncbi:MAG: hypothetical protein ACI4QM_04965 [Alphaproteobacteria bacterium]